MARPAALDAPSSAPSAVDGGVRDALTRWQTQLATERRASDHTVAAYLRDVAAFLDFVSIHCGERVSLARLTSLRTGDFRAWLAKRVGEGYARTSTARALSSVRMFFGFSTARDWDTTRPSGPCAARDCHVPCPRPWPTRRPET